MNSWRQWAGIQDAIIGRAWVWVDCWEREWVVGDLRTVKIKVFAEQLTSAQLWGSKCREPNWRAGLSQHRWVSRVTTIYTLVNLGPRPWFAKLMEGSGSLVCWKVGLIDQHLGSCCLHQARQIWQLSVDYRKILCLCWLLWLDLRSRLVLMLGWSIWVGFKLRANKVGFVL